MKSMSFTVFSYNATVLLIQPNPWMDPIHVHLWAAGRFSGGFTHVIVRPIRPSVRRNCDNTSSRDTVRGGAIMGLVCRHVIDDVTTSRRCPSTRNAPGRSAG